MIVDHVRHAINVGGEDAVGLGGDLDGVDALPAGFEGVADYPRIAELLARAGLTAGPGGEGLLPQHGPDCSVKPWTDFARHGIRTVRDQKETLLHAQKT